MSSPNGPESESKADADDTARIEHARQALANALRGSPSLLREASPITPRLFISDISTARKLPTLRALAITHVVTVMERMLRFPLDLDLAVLHVRLDDLPSEDLLSHLPRTTEFIADALRDENARVLVHCWQGVSRSASIVAGFLIATGKMSAEDAVKFIQAKRRVIKPNAGFMRQLRQYEILLQAEDDTEYSTK